MIEETLNCFIVNEDRHDFSNANKLLTCNGIYKSVDETFVNADINKCHVCSFRNDEVIVALSYHMKRDKMM